MAPLRRTRADVRWEEASKLHCTLKFLGPTPSALLPALEDAISASTRGSNIPSILYGGIGGFPSLRDPKVLWIGVKETTGTLAALQASVEDRCAALGLPREERPFHPHVTLGRVKSRKNIRELLETAETVTFESPATAVGTLALIRSDLRPSGSVYTVLREFPLGS
jgi:2'-5' RNA ligase